MECRLETELVAYAKGTVEGLVPVQGFETCAVVGGVGLLVLAIVCQDIEVKAVVLVHFPLGAYAAPDTVEVGVVVAQELIVGKCL